MTKVKRKEVAALILGGIGIFILDLGFNGSAASDLFFPPQLRKILPPVIANASLPLPPAPAAPAGLGGYVPGSQNIYLYFIGGAILAVAMLILMLSNRNAGREPAEGPKAAHRSS
jgi:hypothetical protein